MKKIQRMILCLLTFTLAMPMLAQEGKTPAFPGAEGFGRYTAGGRGGKVYHVTNLNDDGEGSLRWALRQGGPRTIVFDVDGTIQLQSKLQIPSNTTIAGQTAPGMGICVAGYPCLIHGNNVIVRYMRMRLGSVNAEDCDDSWDGFGALDYRNIMIDHCSVSWSFDECLSIGGCINSTVQWCIISQSLVNVGHSKGNHGYGGNWGGSGSSFHHNLMMHHTSRCPRLGPRPSTQLDERVDMRNNVLYNWSGEGCYGGEAMKANIVNNYYKPGPGTKEKYSGKPKIKRIFAPGVRTNTYVNQYPEYAPTLHVLGKYYITGNTNTESADVAADNWANGVLNQIDNSDNDNQFTATAKQEIQSAEPIPFVHTTTHSAEEAYNHVVAYAGACKGGQWDALDDQFLYDVKNNRTTATGDGLDWGFINTENDNTAIVSAYGSAWPTLTAGTAKTDTDGDGMPDDWETANGLDPNNAADGNAKNEEGYTNLEVYMNSLVADITANCTDGTIEGQEEVPASLYDNTELSDHYVIVKDDEHVVVGGTFTEVDGITVTLDPSVTDWKTGGSSSAAQTVDGIDLTGYYCQSNGTNGAPITITTTQPGTFTVFLGGNIATNKSVNMTEGENGLTGTVLSTGATIESGSKPAEQINQWDGIYYQLEAGKTYTFFCGGTKWRMAAFRYITNTTGISNVKASQQEGTYHNLQGIKVAYPTQKGIYIHNGHKVVIK